MSIIKRLYTTLSASVDQLVGEIENHDALVAATIKEQRRKLAAARVQLKRLQDSERQAEEESRQLRDKAELWRVRAIQFGHQDQQKALTCIQYKQQIEQRIAQVDKHLQQYQSARQHMCVDIDRCEQQIRDVSQKYALFRARQHSSEALAVVNGVSVDCSEDLATCFDRWDNRITQQELVVLPESEVDVFEQQFINEENRVALQRELSELLAAAETQAMDKR